MPVAVSYPGVYIQERPSGVRTITGVSTSIALFIGMTARGRLGIPVRLLNFTEYRRTFGDDRVISEMTDQVQQFFQNGGQQAFVMRIADNTATPASVDLENEDGDVVLNVEAKDAGVIGSLIRLEVDYNTPSSEDTFNLRVFRVLNNGAGEPEIETDETFPNLSMDSSSGSFVETIVNQQSVLIDISLDDTIPAAGPGFSRAGILVDTDDANALATLNNAITNTANSIQISVDDGPFVPIRLDVNGPLSTGDLPALTNWENAINTMLTQVGAGQISASLVAGPTNSRYVEFRSNKGSGGSVRIRPAVINNVAAVLQLGVAQGGLEMSGFAVLRPAPTGYFAHLGGAGLNAFSNFVGATDIGQWTLTDASGLGPYNATPTFADPGNPIYSGTVSTDIGVGSLLNVRENLRILANSINANVANQWKASLQGVRLVLRPRFGGVNSDISAQLTSDGALGIGNVGELFDPSASANVSSYSLGSGGIGNYQANGVAGNDGSVPSATDYRNAFDVVKAEVDLFNLLLLPRANGQSDTDRENVWGSASTFCQGQRAFLLVDPRSSWENSNDVDNEIDLLRGGLSLVNDHAAIYWPRVLISDNGSTRPIDPSGSIAGVMARTDSNRGVWKAPAGLEATIRGARGLEHMISDEENGIINLRAVNAIRIFPNGIISWGARTMDGFDNSGNDDYKYVPVRRVALFIEESLYRGLKFAVFEPNDEPLWAQIRLAAGAFMNNLFRQGAFQGQKASDAYFVKVDSETTTQNDINLGIVNVVIGFAPLKPAEFVIITIQQMAGEVQV